MPGPRKAISRAIVLILAVFVAGTLGYRAIEGSSWWDAFYMTVITVTTVGFSEEFPLSETGELFTVLLLFSGLGLLLFLVTETSRSVLEGELGRYLGRVRSFRMIDRMIGHDIVCGYGRMGRAVVDELRRAGHTVVIVDRSSERVRCAEELGVATIVGDATSEEVLRSANLLQARGLVACLNDDAHNVYTVITARSLKPDILIVARATEESAADRIRLAGADRVVNPYQLGGFRLAHLVVKPEIANFFDPSLAGGDLQLDQSSLRADSPVVGQTLGDSDFRQTWGLSVVAVQRGGDVTANPGPMFKLVAGDVVVVFGSRTRISEFDKQCGGSR